MKDLRKIALIATGLLVISNANANDNANDADAQEVTITKEIKKATPKGLEALKAYNMGDLNKDKKDDYALVVASTDKNADNKKNGLVMMISNKDGKYDCPLVKTGFIETDSADSTAKSAPSLRFKTHNNKLQLCYTDNNKGEHTFVFKYIPKNDGWFKLISSKHNYLNEKGKSVKSNINYLTEKMEVEEGGKTTTYRIKVEEELNFKKIESLDLEADKKYMKSGKKE